ncbi:MAG: hypothetical protein NTV49_13070 [Kiritimatiellaeota bacterium]|nr:hypothetical protein [Kiritimatiellota bacterium]
MRRLYSSAPILPEASEAKNFRQDVLLVVGGVRGDTEVSRAYGISQARVSQINRQFGQQIRLNGQSFSVV